MKNIVSQIDQHWADTKNEPGRPHLGASLIGTDCERALWYGFRWASKIHFDGRLLRLFDRGHSEEPRFIRDLKAIGITVYDRDPETGKQFNFSEHGGHFAGSSDGIALIDDMPTVLEFKTSADKPFQDMVKKGVMESKPLHYAQMQVYMAWHGYSQALYMMVNKNDDNIYEEIIQADPKAYNLLAQKAERVISAQVPPTRISASPSAFECKWCDHFGTCHNEKPARVSCRTCISATPVTTGEGGWHCDHHNLAIPLDVQRTACPEHRFIPPLLPFGENPKAEGREVTYQLIGSDREFTNGTRGQNSYDSLELQELDASTVTDPGIEAMREKFDGRVTSRVMRVEFDPEEIPF